MQNFYESVKNRGIINKFKTKNSEIKRKSVKKTFCKNLSRTFFFFFLLCEF